MSGQEQWILLNGEPLWVVAAVVVVLLAAVSGHTTGSKRPPPVRLALFGVRMLALALALVVILRPALEEDLVRAKRPPLAVVVDRSASMKLGDPSASAAVVEWLEENSGQLEALEEHYKLKYWRLADPPLEIRPSSLAEGFGPESFSDKQTPLAKSLEELSRLQPELSGAILLSDGNDTEDQGRSSALPFPVYPVIPAGGLVTDLWIDEVRAPPVAFIRAPVELKVSLGAVGIAGESVELSLVEEGSIITSKEVKVSSGRAEIALNFTPRRTGRKAYELTVSKVRGEEVVQNNRKRFSLDVIRDKTRVLLVGGTPTWDSKFLRRRLRQDPGIDLITFMILRTPADIMNTKEGEMSLIPFPTEELFNSELSSFDVVIMSNFDFGPYVPRRYLDNMERFVREAGGGLVMLGGDRSFGLGGYVGSSLEKALPVDLSGSIPGRQFRAGPFRARMTGGGLSHPVFSALPDATKNRQLWDGLGELDGLNWALRARPGATVALETPQVTNEYGAAPVIALGDYGSGRTMAVMTDSLWRWKMPYASRRGQENVYADFWARALRWLVHDPEMELMRIAPPPEGLRQGEEVRFTSRVFDRSYKPASGALLTATLSKAGELPVEAGGAGEAIVLKWHELKPGEYISEPVALKDEGLWHLEAKALQGAIFLGTDELGFPVKSPDRELERIGVNREALEDLAKNSGGEIVEGETASLFTNLASRSRAEVEIVGRTVTEPWAKGWILALSIFLFCTDWLLRRILE